MNRSTRPRLLLAAAGLTLAVALAACGTGSTTATTSTTSTAPDSDAPATAMTGMTGMTTADPDAAHNDADVLFVTQMLPHHEGAIAMTVLAPDRASDQAVKDLAAQIQAEQQPEIDEMNSWLTAWGASMGTGSTMDMTPGTTARETESTASGMEMQTAGGMAMSGGMMSGMMSEQDMAALTAATGADFDRLFLQLMITHHQGAVDMADVEIGSGANPAALALAASIRAGQTAEIATMRSLLAGM